MMSARNFHWLGRQRPVILLVALTGIGGAVLPCHADVITDWDAKASAVASPAALGERELAIVDIAMFDAVNSISPRYRPYLVKEDGFSDASAEAAAASAAACALENLHPQSAAEFKAALDEYVKGLPASRADVAKGIRLGELVAQRVFDSRAADGSAGVDSYRPRTQPGVYVATTTMVAATWPKLRPLVLERPDQFRPGPPVALDSPEWASDYNEVKTYGARNSTLRTPEQTETAKFWLMTGPQAYHPIVRQLISARHMKLVDSARFMAAFAAAMTDAYIAVFEAKYHYEFWRPITAIRNGDIDGNPATEIDPLWQPLDATPMHPEYPCAHCLLSGAAAAVIESYGGLQGVQDISLTSPTTPGITHRWSSLDAFTSEVANARVWAGFHYRSSGRVGTAMGREVGSYVASNFAQPQNNATHSTH
jgi:PAP2 superfamily